MQQPFGQENMEAAIIGSKLAINEIIVLVNVNNYGDVSDIRQTISYFIKISNVFLWENGCFANGWSIIGIPVTECLYDC